VISVTAWPLWGKRAVGGYRCALLGWLGGVLTPAGSALSADFQPCHGNTEAAFSLEWLLTNGSLRNGMPSWSRLPEQQRWRLSLSEVPSVKLFWPDQDAGFAVPA